MTKEERRILRRAYVGQFLAAYLSCDGVSVEDTAMTIPWAIALADDTIINLESKERLEDDQ